MGKNKLNPDKEIVKSIIDGLKAKKAKYGEKYCPCVTTLDHSVDTICPCKQYRENNYCCCKLYI